jgi:hypothetical protein
MQRGWHLRRRNGAVDTHRYSAGVTALAALPTVQLELTVPGFELDLFIWGHLTLVSQRLREAMALDKTTVQYSPVDASSSTDLVRSKNYQIMEIVASEHFLDAERFVRENGDAEGPIGSLKIVDKLNITHELFRDRFIVALIYCTDALALRVLTATCTGVLFVDPLQYTIGVGRCFRTLRGIEELVDWDDSVEGGERTEVVKWIH